ncbi:MAG: type II toxin-antitoxin system Phd/YefM family antitoxin [Candidatus Omnitrophica bacterium]|nr:type II toxin-antitoxin system Phd/YefM family antitoxin [Candidatus Omnitrophota bacterium]
MSIETTYTHARENLASLWDAAVEDHEVIIIRRRGSEPVAMMAASELSGLMESAHLLRSPANASRLMKALKRAEVRTITPSSVPELRRELSLENTA